MKELKALRTFLVVLAIILTAAPCLAAVTTNYEYDDQHHLTKISRNGTTTEYRYDEVGNRTQKIVTIQSASDTIAPLIGIFTMPSVSNTLTVTGIVLSATDAVAVTGYLITESSAPPLPDASGWNAAAPTSYSFTAAGSKTLYAWAKDAAGNVSANMQASITISVSATIKQLTNNSSDNIQPSWAPDGTTIAFISNRINGLDGSDLFAIQPDGQNERILAQFTVTDTWHGRFGQPSWIGQSGDLLIMDYKYYHEVMRFNLSGAVANNALPVGRSIYDGNSSYVSRLLFVPGGQGGGTPVTSSDGLKLAWRHTSSSSYLLRMYSGNPNVSIGNTDTAGTLLLQVTGGGWIVDPISFSPDGTKLVFAGCISNCQGKGSDLHIIDVDTKAINRITTSGDQGASSNYPTWSSNNIIAFSWRTDDTAKYDLYTIKPDGTGQSRLTENIWDSIYPSWSPDGNSIVFSSNASGNYNIYTMTGLRPISVNGACGSSNGGTFTVVPSNNLCATGSASVVSGSGPWSWTCTGVNSGTNASCSADIQAYDLTVTLSGNGAGTITSDPIGISCKNDLTSGCNASFDYGTEVTLIPTLASDSIFTAWGDACTATSGNCTVAMTANKSVTATFTAAPKVKIGTTGYNTLQAAYNDAISDTVIQLLEGNRTDPLIANRPITVTIKGGCNAVYSAIAGETTIDGQILLRNGTVKMERVNVK